MFWVMAAMLIAVGVMLAVAAFKASRDRPDDWKADKRREAYLEGLSELHRLQARHAEPEGHQLTSTMDEPEPFFPGKALDGPPRQQR